MESFIYFTRKGGTISTLNLSFGTKTVSTGEYLPRAEAVSAPRISYSQASPSTRYIIVCIDPDGPFPWFNILSPIVHWIQSDLTVDASSGSLTTTESFIVNYVGPGPPPGSSPHRYIFFLYEQPSTFRGKDHAPPNRAEVGLWPRIRWFLAAWEQEADLGKPIAMGYFTSN